VDPLLVLMAVAMVAGTIAVVWQYRRRPEPQAVESDPRDEWELPDEPTLGTPTPASLPPAPPGAARPLLDRDMLLNRDRTLDTSKWDDSPDAAPAMDRAFFEGLREQPQE
jgi:hypothetical protein